MRTAAKKAAKPETKTVTLPFVRTTPGTHVYGIGSKDPVICKQIYLNRSEMPDSPPETVTLTVAW